MYRHTMKTRVLVRMTLIGTGCALALAGCGGEREAGSRPVAAQAAPTPAATPAHTAARLSVALQSTRWPGKFWSPMPL